MHAEYFALFTKGEMTRHQIHCRLISDQADINVTFRSHVNFSVGAKCGQERAVLASAFNRDYEQFPEGHTKQD